MSLFKNLLDSTALTSVLGTATGADDFGSFTGSTIPDGSDAKQALQALETAVENIPAGPEGPAGPSGPADNTYSDLSAFKASDVSNAVASLAGVAGVPDGRFFWTLGDFTGQADDINVIKSDANALSIGAWVRQKAVSILAADGDNLQVNLDHGGYNDDPIFSSATYLKTTSDIINSEEVNLLRGVPKSEWAAIAAGTSDYDCAPAFASIMADMDSYGVKGGTLLIPRGKFLVTAPVETVYRASIRGVGSRSSIITVPDGSSDDDFPDGVMLVKNQIDATPLMFSTCLRDFGAVANGLSKGITYFGAQENSIVDNVLISQFTGIGFYVPPFANTTHGASFTNLHIVPLGGSTAAIGFDATDLQKCFLWNITTDIDQSIGDGYYAHGIKLHSNCVGNVIGLVHTEDADIGIEEIGGGFNRFMQIEAARSTGTSAAHFKSSNNTHVIEGIRTRYGYTNQYVQGAYTIPASAELFTRRIAPNNSGLEYTDSAGSRVILGTATSDASASGAVELRKGVQVIRGSLGYGKALTTEQINLPASSSVFLEIDTGNTASTGFSGTLSIDVFNGGTGAPFNTKASFSGAVTSAGAMVNGLVSDQFGGTNLTKLTISAPTALSTATAGKFHIEIANSVAAALIGQVSVEMAQSVGSIKSISVKSS